MSINTKGDVVPVCVTDTELASGTWCVVRDPDAWTALVQAAAGFGFEDG